MDVTRSYICVCISVCIRVLFYLKRLVTLSAHLGQNPVQVTQTSHSWYRSSPANTAELRLLGNALPSYFREAKQLERREFSYNPLFDTHEAKGP